MQRTIHRNGIHHTPTEYLLMLASKQGVIELVPGSAYDKAAQALVEEGKLVQHKTGGHLYGYTSSYSPVQR